MSRKTTKTTKENCTNTTNNQAFIINYINTYDLLTNDETNELIIKAQSGDKEAREKVTLHNLRLVVYSAKKFLDKEGACFDDLFQEGSIGLDHAIDLFKPTSGNKFSTYCVAWIEKYMRNEIMKNGRNIRLPSHIHEFISKVLKGKEALIAETGKEPTSEELANYLGDGYDSNAIDEVNQLAYSTRTDTLDREVFEDTSMYEVISNTYENETEEIVVEERYALVDDMLSKLDPKSAYVLVHTFGLKDEDKLTAIQMSKNLGVSANQIAVIQAKALNFLKNQYNRESLRAFF